ncbi:MAG: hypothetical protein DMD60_09020 [Gemmatimonadetes bacterium]|nr:MAG: hypothetical protein DMD60_09020 [Gemmatimonadota bacterium]
MARTSCVTLAPLSGVRRLARGATLVRRPRRSCYAQGDAEHRRARTRLGSRRATLRRAPSPRRPRSQRSRRLRRRGAGHDSGA